MITKLQWFLAAKMVPADNRKVVIVTDTGEVKAGNYSYSNWYDHDIRPVNVVAWAEFPEAPIFPETFPAPEGSVE